MVWLFAAVCLSCANNRAIGRPGPYYESYLIVPAADNDNDGKYASYLYSHLANRTYGELFTQTPNPEVSQLRVEVHYDPDASHDYAVEVDDDTLRLTAKTREVMMWLLYQFISDAGEADLRIDANELPPALVRFDGEDHEGDFAFEYRGIYSPSNADEELLAIRGTNHVDYDWGLWGHHLPRVFPDGQIPEGARALVDGHRRTDQLCMSSDQLFRAYERYILDKWGEGSEDEQIRFAVMPEDNALVCQCAACRAAGNTTTSATPALTNLLARLAERFPHHLFFAGGYSSTIDPPAEPLPPNTGVLLSALDVPMVANPASTPQGRDFEENAKKWSHVVGRVYVWDYMRNFDDYFTPYPFLHLMPERLKWYKDLGVRGMFFNGSGDSYASFDEVQTFVLSCLLVDPDANVEQCVHEFYDRTSPGISDLLVQYYMGMEHSVTGRLPIYGNMADAMKAGFDVDKMRQFEQQLRRSANKTDDVPRKKVNMLLTALSFSELEAMRVRGEYADTSRIQSLCNLLWCHDSFPNMCNYRESNGDIDAYLRQWTDLANNPMPRNTLQGVKLAARVPLDPDYPSTVCLTDGQRGFATDYHTGWLIFSGPELRLEFCGMRGAQAQNVYVGMLNAPDWHIELPDSVELWQNGQRMAQAAVPTDVEPFTRVEVAVPTAGVVMTQPFELRIPRRGRSMALDEVRM